MAANIMFRASSAVLAPRSASRSAALRPRCALPTCRITVARALSDAEEAIHKHDLGNGTPAVAGFAALAPLLAAFPAHADEAAAADAAASSAGGFGAGEAALLLTPVLVYALFNVYRDRVNPQAKFLDYIYIMAFLAIVANLFSIVVFKTRFF